MPIDQRRIDADDLAIQLLRKGDRGGGLATGGRPHHGDRQWPPVDVHQSSSDQRIVGVASARVARPRRLARSSAHRRWRHVMHAHDACATLHRDQVRSQRGGHALGRRVATGRSPRLRLRDRPASIGTPSSRNRSERASRVCCGQWSCRNRNRDRSAGSSSQCPPSRQRTGAGPGSRAPRRPHRRNVDRPAWPRLALHVHQHHRHAGCSGGVQRPS